MTEEYPYEITQHLYHLARMWPLYESSYIDRRGIPRVCHRCNKDLCGEMITPTVPAVKGIMLHLMTSHGYRMDGRQFDNHNNEIGHAKNACC